MILSTALRTEMVAHAMTDYPLECCGVIAAKDGIPCRTYPVGNVAASPIAYLMDEHQQFEAFMAMEDAGLELWGSYHSHPQSPPLPSLTDIKQASRWADLAPDIVSVIIGLGRDPTASLFRAWRLADGNVREVSLDA